MKSYGMTIQMKPLPSAVLSYGTIFLESMGEFQCMVLPFPEMKPFWLHFCIKLFIVWGFFFKKTEFLCESFLWQPLGMKGLTRLLTLRLHCTEWTLDLLKNLTRNFIHSKSFKINVLFTRKWWTTSSFNLSQWVFTIYQWREHCRRPAELPCN